MIDEQSGEHPFFCYHPLQILPVHKMHMSHEAREFPPLWGGVFNLVCLSRFV